MVSAGDGGARSAPDASYSQWTATEKWSMAVTVAIVVVAGFVAAWAYSERQLFALALAAGALGGLVHELTQSYGTMFFVSKHEDGLYLGSITGIVLGAAAGAITAQSQVLLAPGADARAAATAIGYAAFLAGLALKGITEAATGMEVDKAVGTVKETATSAVEKTKARARSVVTDLTGSKRG